MEIKQLYSLNYGKKDEYYVFFKKKKKKRKQIGFALLLSNAKTLYKKCRYTLPRMNIEENVFL